MKDVQAGMQPVLYLCRGATGLDNRGHNGAEHAYRSNKCKYR